MSASFYVKDIKGNLVPAQFLVDNGQQIADPNITNAQNLPLFNASGTQIQNGNPNGLIIVPYGYSLDQARSFGAQIAKLNNTPMTPAVGLTNAFGAMIAGFVRGGTQDLQRNYSDINGNAVSNGTPVIAFQDAASYVLGVATAVAGFPASFAIVGGGIYNTVFTSGRNTKGAVGNNPLNVNSINAGFNHITNPPATAPGSLNGIYNDKTTGAQYGFNTSSSGALSVAFSASDTADFGYISSSNLSFDPSGNVTGVNTTYSDGVRYVGSYTSGSDTSQAYNSTGSVTSQVTANIGTNGNVGFSISYSGVGTEALTGTSVDPSQVLYNGSGSFLYGATQADSAGFTNQVVISTSQAASALQIIDPTTGLTTSVALNNGSSTNLVDGGTNAAKTSFEDVQSSQSGGQVYDTVFGQSTGATISGGVITLEQGASINVTGNNNNVALTPGSGNYAGILGAGNIITGDTAGNEINVAGPSGSATTVYGNGYVGIINSGDQITLESSGASVVTAANLTGLNVTSALGYTVNLGAGTSGNFSGVGQTVNLNSNGSNNAGVFGTGIVVNNDSGNDITNLGGVGTSATVSGGGYVGLVANNQVLTLGTAGSSVATAANLTGLQVTGANYGANIASGVSGKFSGTGATVTLTANSSDQIKVQGTGLIVNNDSGSNGVNIGTAGSTATVNGGGSVGLINSSETLTLGTAGSTVTALANDTGLQVTGTTYNLTLASGDSGNFSGTGQTVNLVSNGSNNAGVFGTGIVVNNDSGNDITNLGGVGTSATVSGGGYVGLVANNQVLTLGTAGSSVATAANLTGLQVTGTQSSINLGSGSAVTVAGNSDAISAATKSGSSITVSGNGDVINSRNNGITISSSNSNITVNGSKNTFAFTGSSDILTVNQTQLFADETSESDVYSVGNGKSQEISGKFSYTDGTSEQDYFNPSSTVAATYNVYSGANQSGSVTESGQVNTDQTSQITLYNPDTGISTETFNFNAAGDATTEADKFTDGTSASGVFAYNGDDNPASEVVQYYNTSQQFDGSADVTYDYDSNGNPTGSQVSYYTGAGQYEGYQDYNADGGSTGGTYSDSDGGGYVYSVPSGGYGGYGGYDFAKGVGSGPSGSNIGVIAKYDQAIGDSSAALGAEDASARAEIALQAPEVQGLAGARYEGAKLAFPSSSLSDISSPKVVTWSFATGSGSQADPFSGTIGASYKATIERAINAWDKASGLTFEEVSDSAQSAIRIGWGDFDTQTSGVLGYTSYEQQNGVFQPGTIVRLEDPSQTALTGKGLQATYAGTDATLYQTVLHEIGHALGLADNSDPSSALYAQSSSTNRKLDSTDVDGIRALYDAPSLKGAGDLSASTTAVGLVSLNQHGLNLLVQAMASMAPDVLSSSSSLLTAAPTGQEHTLAPATHG